MFDQIDCPVFITCRDRVTDLRQLVGWLEAAGHQRIILLDNDSAWPPMLDYLAGSPHEVRRLNGNYGSQALWSVGMAPDDEWFVLTDPDIVPLDTCPGDAVTRLYEVLQRHPEMPKAGLGLYLDDLPPRFDQTWERSLSDESRQLEPNAYRSQVDTTFALYPPGRKFAYEAIRLGSPYLARHMGWYAESAPTQEDVFYLSRAAPGGQGSSWLTRLIVQEVKRQQIAAEADPTTDPQTDSHD